MRLGASTNHVVIRHAHMACGIGAGARGFNQANPRVGDLEGRFVCAGGIDVDPGAIANFEMMTGVPGTVMDLFNEEQFRAFHGKAPPPGWREAVPDDIRRTFGDKVDILFASYPCKGFSGLLSNEQSLTDKYQALNSLTLRGQFLTLEAYRDDPIPIIIFENVPRISTRGRWLLDQIVALYHAYGYHVAESVHDCGEVGELAQSRKRFLLVARHPSKVPDVAYEPVKHQLRGVGEVIGQLPLPGDPAGGPMHRIPMLQWRTWVRLAFVPAGKDWRALNELAVENGMLRDFGIVPEGARDNAYGVCRWTDTGPLVTSARAPGQGRFSVADPRATGAVWNADVLGVRDWNDKTGVVAARSSPTNGAYSIADPRPGYGSGTHRHVLGVLEWTDTAFTVIGSPKPTSGAFAIADIRPQQANQTYKQYGVRAWGEPTGAVSGQSTAGGGAFSIADPRLGRIACTWGPNSHRNKLKVVSMAGAAPTVTGSDRVGSGAISVADPRPGLSTGPSRGGYLTQGHYGVLSWGDTSLAVPGFAKYDRGKWSLADPRGLISAPSSEAPKSNTLPAPDQRLVARIIATDGTWHRPFTTLELAALQSLFDPEDAFALIGKSDATMREWIGNAVPSKAAKGMAETLGEALLRARLGITFSLSTRSVWVSPIEMALAVNSHQPARQMDAGLI